MFGVQKFLLLVLLVLLAWFGLRRIGATDRPPGNVTARQADNRNGLAQLPAEPLVQCPVCGVYAAARTRRTCDRPDCPIR